MNNVIGCFKSCDCHDLGLDINTSYLLSPLAILSLMDVNAHHFDLMELAILSFFFCFFRVMFLLCAPFIAVNTGNKTDLSDKGVGTAVLFPNPQKLLEMTSFHTVTSAARRTYTPTHHFAK